MHAVKDFFHARYAFLNENGVSFKHIWEVSKYASKDSTPVQDLKEVALQVFRELKNRKEHTISKKSVSKLFSIAWMGCAALSATALTAEALFKKAVYGENPDSPILSGIVLTGITVLFFMTWGLVIHEIQVARGLKQYKKNIDDEAAIQRQQKEGTVLIFDLASDYNGAFDLSYRQAANYERLSERFKISSKTTRIVREIVKKIHRCADRSDDIKVMGLLGHGSPYGTKLGDSKPEEIDPLSCFLPTELTGYEPGLEAALDRLNPHAVIFIKSCSAAGNPDPGICISPNWASRNTAYRIAALANKRKVIAPTEPANRCVIENDPTSADQGLSIKFFNKHKEDITLHIQENEQNTHEFEEIRTAIYAARATVDIEKAVLKLREKEGVGQFDSIRLSVSCPEKMKKYVQYTLEGLLGNRVGVESVDYGDSAADAATYQILGELAKFSIIKNGKQAQILTAK